MTTRLERAQASLKREEHKADLKRLKQARDYMRLASEFLKGQFHNKEFEDYANDARPEIANLRQHLTNIIGIEK